VDDRFPVAISMQARLGRDGPSIQHVRGGAGALHAPKQTRSTAVGGPRLPREGGRRVVAVAMTCSWLTRHYCHVVRPHSFLGRTGISLWAVFWLSIFKCFLFFLKQE
jgi:hypothetical protein